MGTTTLGTAAAPCPRCRRQLAREPDGTVFCVQCATPGWWQNLSSTFPSLSGWRRGALWSLCGLFVAAGIAPGWHVWSEGLKALAYWVFESDVPSLPYDLDGALYMSSLLLAIGYPVGTAISLRAVLKDRLLIWVPLWLVAVGVVPWVVTFFID